MKKFLFIILTFILFMVGVWNARGDSNDMALIKSFILSPLSEELVHGEGYVLNSPVQFKTLTTKEDLTQHGNFEWRYNSHFVTLYSRGGSYFLEFRVKEFQEFVSPDSRGVVHWKFLSAIVTLDFSHRFEPFGRLLRNSSANSIAYESNCTSRMVGALSSCIKITRQNVYVNVNINVK